MNYTYDCFCSFNCTPDDSWAWGSIVVKALRYYSEGRVTGDFFRGIRS
jgi:hypothetical protein